MKCKNDHEFQTPAYINWEWAIGSTEKGFEKRGGLMPCCPTCGATLL